MAEAIKSTDFEVEKGNGRLKLQQDYIFYSLQRCGKDLVIME